jgi:hypothetical protein
MSPFWHLEFGSGSYIPGKFEAPSFRYIKMLSYKIYRCQSTLKIYNALLYTNISNEIYSSYQYYWIYNHMAFTSTTGHLIKYPKNTNITLSNNI